MRNTHFTQWFLAAWLYSVPHILQLVGAAHTMSTWGKIFCSVYSKLSVPRVKEDSYFSVQGSFPFSKSSSKNCLNIWVLHTIYIFIYISIFIDASTSKESSAQGRNFLWILVSKLVSILKKHQEKKLLKNNH